jgi:leucyl aminopeptidase
MLACFTDSTATTVPLYLVHPADCAQWLTQQKDSLRSWAHRVGFQARKGEICIVPATDGGISAVLLGVSDREDALQVGILPSKLPAGNYSLALDGEIHMLSCAATAWGLGSYRFTRYKSAEPYTAKLLIPSQCDAAEINQTVSAIYRVRDLINTSPQDMNTSHLAAAAHEVAQECGAEYNQIEGVDLLTENYPMIYAVGKGSESEPHLIDLHWGKKTHPKVTLVGKGVCFDTGGLDLKNADGMRYMKKDMGGAAHVLGLAQMIIQAKLPIQLRVLIPAVENAISGSAYHPGDVLKSRKGLTVEVTNTDAEGRLILADALTEAASEEPVLIIDIATLTGAARVALGHEIGALFTDDDTLANDLLRHAKITQDPLWRLPIYQNYRAALDSPVADLCNAAMPPFTAGAINAALFLKEFVGEKISWAHLDIMAWNPRATSTGPEGAEANAIRAIYSYLKERFQ